VLLQFGGLSFGRSLAVHVRIAITVTPCLRWTARPAGRRSVRLSLDQNILLAEAPCLCVGGGNRALMAGAQIIENVVILLLFFFLLLVVRKLGDELVVPSAKLILVLFVLLNHNESAFIVVVK